MNRHLVSHLELKALDNDQRIIEGWASRPEVDRVGDIVESKGATYRLPLPLLMDHNHTAAVGDVIEATASDAGIRFKAKIAQIAEPGAIKDLCDSAWSAAKAGLRRAVSIGFRAIDAEPMASGGMRFKRWEWYELSLVAVPACAGATIDQLKSIDRDLRRNRGHIVRLDKPVGGVSKTGHRVVRLDAPIGKRTATARPVSHAMMDAAHKVQEDAERYEAMKALGPAHLMLSDAMTAGARATDAALEEMRARLARLETRNG